MTESLESYVGRLPLGIYSNRKTPQFHYPSLTTWHPTIARAEIVLREEAGRNLLTLFWDRRGTIMINDGLFDRANSNEPDLTSEALWALSTIGAVTCNGYSWTLTAWGWKRTADVVREKENK
jgi:hypothetical protein